MKKLLLLLPIFTGIVFAKDVEGFYVGIGTGFNITANHGLTKVYNASNVKNEGIPAVQYLGNVSGYSMPFSANLGYRFNDYVSAEVLYTYSGNQQYQKASNDLNGTDFWGSQNTVSLNAVGYLPLINERLYLKGRIGLGETFTTMTTYIGNPGRDQITSSLGMGLQYLFAEHLSVDFDYVNYGLLIPINVQYMPSSLGYPALGQINSQQENLFLFSLNYHF